MYGLHRFGIKLELDTIKHILNELDNPQSAYRIIHIAGTNGKGSVAAMVSTILMTAGYRVGRYTSPHLIKFNERICINDQQITDNAVANAYNRVNAIKQPDRQPTFFEITTAMALDVFRQESIDWAVLETGMGGRMDATNIIDPQITVITNISMEHKQYLGNTIPEIAYEKAGIIKPGIPIITGISQQNAKHVINEKAASSNAPAYQKGLDFKVRQQRNNCFSYHGITHKWQSLELRLSGRHQIQNAALALAVCEILHNNGCIEIDESTIRSGLLQTTWPGRMELFSTAPHLILDGAHNLMAARMLSNHLCTEFKGRKITLVVGILDDKPYQSMLKDLSISCNRIIVTQPAIERAIPANVLEKEARMLCPNVEIIPKVSEAVQKALDTSSDKDVICIAGSLYVVGEAKSALSASVHMN
ncbi:MAG: bifunctional folylpolyglutamate synthase/dihydrofolate synthase [Desulfobacteraceae bacterium]|nr:bifunctional folylpolyglutamate synthase/dihydrofolate synthase [Desulfobacteraceae bacterium]